MRTTGWAGVGNSILVTLLTVGLAVAYMAVVVACVLAVGFVWPAIDGWLAWAVVYALVKVKAAFLAVLWLTRAWGLDLARRRPS